MMQEVSHATTLSAVTVEGALTSTSGQVIRPHRRRALIVQSYSPGGANVHPI